MTAFNKLTPAEIERLVLVSEECAEVIHAISKILRHGYESCHPETTRTNRRALAYEIGNLERVVELLVEDAEDVKEQDVRDGFMEKCYNLDTYLHHNKHLIE